MIDCSKK